MRLDNIFDELSREYLKRKDKTHIETKYQYGSESIIELKHIFGKKKY